MDLQNWKLLVRFKELEVKWYQDAEAKVISQIWDVESKWIYYREGQVYFQKGWQIYKRKKSQQVSGEPETEDYIMYMLQMGCNQKSEKYKYKYKYRDKYGRRTNTQEKHRSKFHESQQGKTRHSWVATTGCATARSAMLQITSRTTTKEDRTRRRRETLP